MAISKSSQERYVGNGWLDEKCGNVLEGLISLTGSTVISEAFMGQSYYVREEVSTIFEVVMVGPTSADTIAPYWQIKTMPIGNSASAITSAISDAYAACSITGRKPKYSTLVKVGSEINVEHDDLVDPLSEDYNKPATYYVSAIDGTTLTWSRKESSGGGGVYWEGEPDVTPVYPA